MEALEIKATVDGKGRLIIGELLQLRNRQVRVMLLIEEDEEEREDWYRLATGGLTGGYGDNEPEYSLNMVKEPNPQYKNHEQG